MKGKMKWLWIGLAALLVVVVVVANMSRGSGNKGTPVQLSRVRNEAVTSRVRSPGKIEARTQVNVSADVVGKISRLAVKEGDRVKRGQLLLQLDDTQYRSAYDQTRAALASAEARRREADASLKVSEAAYARQRQLFEQRLLSQQEWDQATQAYEGARSSSAAANEEVARARAAAQGSADNLSKTRFTAPFDGVVSALNVEQGEIVITGTMNNPGTQILTVSDMSRMLVRADVDETDVVDVKLGQKAKITVDAFPDTTFPGTVVEIGSTAMRTLSAGSDGQTNFEVKVVFDISVPEIRPGMTADVDVETATHDKTLSVPIQAVVVRTERELERAAKSKAGKTARAPKSRKGDAVAAEEDTTGRRDKEITGVFVVKDGVATFKPVRTGIASETMIEIFGEIAEKDEVVTGPYKALRELKPNGKVRKETSGPGRAGK
ncbi:MAG: efflux RND transporter periplasmic adaptor subunit [Candidatus Eisenbacteria bacterium]|uniref:Efflux RND transporter periplasmic adaptor subunit n=1 Tax=Eiseniibacteriota bacterium TaxID=2212470 RepID=A0A849SKN6_UNCEI|nr:efflux RND transporter periplasmic adaptor subunit [Candidatus Eisenbacteria bacterium]